MLYRRIRPRPPARPLRWLIINDLLEEIHGVKKADAAEEWTAALDAAERAVDEGRREVSSIAIAIAAASGATRKAGGTAPFSDFLLSRNL